MPDKKQLWSVVASPRTRFQAALLLMHRDLKVKGNKSRRELTRARTALGLHAPHDAFVRYKEAVSLLRKEDDETLHRFEVTAETAECVLGWADKLEQNPLQARWLDDLLEQLDRQADDPRAATAAQYDEVADIAAWMPTGRPILENPWLFSEALGDVIAHSRSWSDFQANYAKGMEPEPAELADQGEDDQQAAA